MKAPNTKFGRQFFVVLGGPVTDERHRKFWRTRNVTKSTADYFPAFHNPIRFGTVAPPATMVARNRVSHDASGDVESSPRLCRTWLAGVSAKPAVQRASHPARILRRNNKPGDVAALVCRRLCPTTLQFALERRAAIMSSTSMVMPASPPWPRLKSVRAVTADLAFQHRQRTAPLVCYPRSNSVQHRQDRHGVDVKADGGYVAAPPSVHPNGKIYRWIDASIEPTHAPGWLLQLARKKPAPTISERALSTIRPRNGQPNAYGLAALDREIEAVAATLPGMRNNALNSAAFRLFQLVAGGELDRAQVIERLIDACHRNGLIEGDGWRSVMTTIFSGARAGLQHPRSRSGAT